MKQYDHRSPLAPLLLVALLLALTPGDAHAHPTHAGTLASHVKPDEGKVDVLLSLIEEDLGRVLRLDTDGNNVVDLEELRAGETVILDYVEREIVLKVEDAPCTPSQRRVARIETGTERARIHLYFEYTCPTPITTLSYTITPLFEDEGGYRHYGRVQVGERIVSAAFNERFPTFELEVAPKTPAAEATETKEGQEANERAGTLQTVLFYTWEGILHILFGFDHVLFVLCLLLVARRFKSLALVVTSFTLGHSITLALSALDLVTLPVSIVEPVIALSIAYVAVENAIRPTEEPRLRFIVTAAFGLIHGFGFSYVLRDDVGLPTDALVPALLSFNLGVELGQLAIVALCWPLLTRIMEKDWYKYVVQGGSAIVLVLSLYWFFERVAGAF